MNPSLTERCRRIDIALHRALSEAEPGFTDRVLPVIDGLATASVVLVAARLARAVQDAHAAADRLRVTMAWERLGPAIVARCDETGAAPSTVLDFFETAMADVVPTWPDDDLASEQAFARAGFVALLALTDVVVSQSPDGRAATLDRIWP